MFNIFLSREVDHQYQKLPLSEKKKVDRILKRLSDNPFKISKKLRGEFEGLLVVRAWPYRLAFTVEKKNIFIVSIRHRQSAYKK